jgi:hypothetical protein
LKSILDIWYRTLRIENSGAEFCEWLEEFSTVCEWYRSTIGREFGAEACECFQIIGSRSVLNASKKWEQETVCNSRDLGSGFQEI